MGYKDRRREAGVYEFMVFMVGPLTVVIDFIVWLCEIIKFGIFVGSRAGSVMQKAREKSSYLLKVLFMFSSEGWMNGCVGDGW